MTEFNYNMKYRQADIITIHRRTVYCSTCEHTLFVCLFVARVSTKMEGLAESGVTLDWVFSCPDIMANI